MHPFLEKLKAQFKDFSIDVLRDSKWFFFGITAFVVVVTIGFHTVPQVLKLYAVKAEIASIQQQNITLDTKILEKESQREEKQKELYATEGLYLDQLKLAFPYQEDIANLTRFLESFSLQLEKRGFMEMNSVSYGSPVLGAEQTEESGGPLDYNVLPVRMSFKADLYNFAAFMEMVRKSGSLESEDFYNDEAIRLMSINKINVSVTESNGRDGVKQQQLYSVNLEISAYFRNPK